MSKLKHKYIDLELDESTELKMSADFGQTHFINYHTLTYCCNVSTSSCTFGVLRYAVTIITNWRT